MHEREPAVVTWSLEFARKIAAALGTNPAAALIDTGEVHLWKDQAFAPTPDTDAAAFAAVEADFTDYVAKSYTPLVPANFSDNVVGATNVVSWAMTTDPAVIDNTIYGAWLEDATGVVAFAAFPEGQQAEMIVTGDRLVLILNLPVPLQVDVEG